MNEQVNEQVIAASTLDASRDADEAIAEYLQATEVGEAPARSKFIQQHSSVRSALESFFDAYDQMDGTTRTHDDKRGGSFAPGGQLGRYRLVRPIGSGTFGTVWLGFDSQLKRPVAIKVPNQKQHDQFLSEAQTVAQLEHPNIVPIYDVGKTVADEVYLVSRFVAGNDLATEMGNRRHSFSEAASCIAHIARALEYAHRRKIVHRDIKPSNILIDSVTRQPHITDFGLARISDNRQDSSVGGTPAYMSPEQASGGTLDHRSDLFSVGVVFYELLCGERPFTGTDASAVMRSIREDEPRATGHFGARVPSVLQEICLKLLSKPFDERYGTSAELQLDLDSYLASESAEACDVRRSEEGPAGQPWFRRVVIAVGSLSLAAGLWFGIARSPGNSVETSTEAATFQAHSISIDRQIAEKTIELGGHVDVRHERTDYEVDSIAKIPDGDISLQWVMFNDGQTIDDEFLSRLRLLDSLWGIDLLSCKFSDSGFTMLADIKSLRCVNAHVTQITDSGAGSLARLPRLWMLNLSQTNITDGTLRRLEGSDTLKRLNVAGTRVTDDGLQSISTMGSLENLNLNDCCITDDGVKHLSSLVNLRVLKLGSTEVTRKSLDYLESCPIVQLVIPTTLPEGAELDFLATHPDCQLWRE